MPPVVPSKNEILRRLRHHATLSHIDSACVSVVRDPWGTWEGWEISIPSPAGPDEEEPTYAVEGLFLTGWAPVTFWGYHQMEVRAGSYRRTGRLVCDKIRLVLRDPPLTTDELGTLSPSDLTDLLNSGVPGVADYIHTEVLPHIRLC